MPYDIVIAGGGPAGLSAALALGRARKRVLLCDAGPPRNAAAVRVHNFVTRDGTPPVELRRIAREQLACYPNVETREVRVEEIRGERGAFHVRLTTGQVEARRILLCTGMIDELPDIDGFRALWGRSIFICPYCHAWEVQNRRFAYLAASVDALPFALFLRGWTSDIVALTDGRFDVPPETHARLASGGVRIEEARIARLVPGSARLNGLNGPNGLSGPNGPDGEEGLERIEFVNSAPLLCDVLFAHPRQRQVPLVSALGLELDPKGYVRVDEMQRETSMPGIYAAGDLLTAAQGALLAAASGTMAAGMLNHALTLELATTGALG